MVWRRDGGLVAGVAALTTSLALSASAALSVAVTYQTWTNLVSWHVLGPRYDNRGKIHSSSDLVRDPLVVALMAIAGVAILEMLGLVVWVWMGSRSAIRGGQRALSIFKKRGHGPEQHNSVGVGAAAVFNLTVMGLTFQLAATGYLLLMDSIFPGLHTHPSNSLTVSRRMEDKRPITTILLDEHPHTMALEEAMAIYHAYQPVLVASYVISILVKTLLLKSYPDLQFCGGGGRTIEKTQTTTPAKETDLRSRIELESCLEEDTFCNQVTPNICHSYFEEDDKNEDVFL